MKKVAIFITSLRGGGAERIVSYLLKEGYEKFELHLILLHKDIEYEIPGEGSIKIFELEGAKASKFSSIFKMKSLSEKLRNYLEENKIDTVISLLNRPNLIACRVKKSGWEGKLIISERADTLAYYKTIRFGWYMIRLVRKYYPYADEVTVISKGIARSLAKLGIKKSHVIYNPIYNSGLDVPVITARPFTFINIARLEPQKNQALLLKAFAKVADKNCYLVILGKGLLLDDLKDLAIELSITDRVNFEGFQSNIKSYLLQSDCFVFSSDYEGLGNVIIEALQAGLPVISTDCPYGPREILSPESDTDTLMKKGVDLAAYGILTPVGNEEYLAEAMQKIIENSVLRNKYRELSKPRALDFDINKIAKKYFDLF
ncbi:MAG: glycosyltransferase [Bacteroidota bacterium]|nr:glycosyltransferase [Bacteroidota bacterium]